MTGRFQCDACTREFEVKAADGTVEFCPFCGAKVKPTTLESVDDAARRGFEGVQGRPHAPPVRGAGAQ